MMTSTKPTMLEIISELKSLSEKLPSTTVGDERRAWLKQFRALLNEADQLAGQDAIQPEHSENY
jgi:hypothetical protein